MSQLAKLAGVSPRTLRYYDQIGLLRPARVTPSGYRIYGPREVDRLQQILFYRELEISLEEINEIMSRPDFDPVEALRDHHRRLLQERSRLDRLIAAVAKTIASREGDVSMSDAEKFAAFKEGLISENEAKFGAQARRMYGSDAVDASNAKLRGMSAASYHAMTALEEEVRSLLQRAVASGDPSSPQAKELAEKHKAWLMYLWSSYSEEAHAGLAELYVADERFKAYYDKCAPGGAEFLRDAIVHYLGRK